MANFCCCCCDITVAVVVAAAVTVAVLAVFAYLYTSCTCHYIYIDGGVLNDSTSRSHCISNLEPWTTPAVEGHTDIT